MLRERLGDGLKAAMKARDQRTTATLRLVLAALKERDIAVREKGNAEGIGEAEITDLLQKLVRQRRDSIALYEQGGRQELARQEAEEIAVIERYLPQALGDDEVQAAITAAITAVGATGIKDMGRVMAQLKERHAGRLDFAKVGAAVKQRLS